MTDVKEFTASEIRGMITTKLHTVGVFGLKPRGVALTIDQAKVLLTEAWETSGYYRGTHPLSLQQLLEALDAGPSSGVAHFMGLSIVIVHAPDLVGVIV